MYRVTWAPPGVRTGFEPYVSKTANAMRLKYYLCLLLCTLQLYT